jgi:hypothetical protein
MDVDKSGGDGTGMGMGKKAPSISCLGKGVVTREKGGEGGTSEEDHVWSEGGFWQDTVRQGDKLRLWYGER